MRIAAILLPLLLAACAKPGPAAEAEAQCKARYDSLMRWVGARGRAPETDEEFDAAAQLAKKDPWGRAYDVEELADGSYRVWSRGPDGEAGTEDDACYPPLD